MQLRQLGRNGPLVSALEIRLAPAQLAALEAVFPPNAAAGDRYPAASMGSLNR